MGQNCARVFFDRALPAYRNRRSVTGYLSTYAGGVKTWNSKKQPTTALSSMEAEYMALAASTCKALWLHTLFLELDLPFNNSLNIFVDNRSTISFAQNLGFHAQLKHIDIRHHFIHKNITSNKVTVSHCASEDNVTNILTKGLDQYKHEHIVKLLRMH